MSIQVQATSVTYQGELSTVTSVVRKWRDHRRSMRNLREIERAIHSAPSTTMRDELIHAAQRQNLFVNH